MQDNASMENSEFNIETPSLFVFDIDGTLVPYGKPISRSVSECLCKLEGMGHTICFASGKPYSYIAGLARGVGLNGTYAIGENGGVMLVGSSPPIITADSPPFFQQLKREILQLFPSVYFQDNHVNLTIFSERENTLPAVARYLEEHGYKSKTDIVIYMHEDAVEILPKGVSKGKSLKRMKESLGWTNKRTIAVGDSENDLSMVAEADIFYVIGDGLSKIQKNRFDNIELFFNHVFDKIRTSKKGNNDGR